MNQVIHHGFRNVLIKEAATKLKKVFYKALDANLTKGLKRPEAIVAAGRQVGLQSDAVAQDLAKMRTVGRQTAQKMQKVKKDPWAVKQYNRGAAYSNKNLGTSIPLKGTELKEREAIKALAKEQAAPLKHNIQQIMGSAPAKKIKDTSGAKATKGSQAEKGKLRANIDKAKSKAKAVWTKHKYPISVAGAGAGGMGIGSLLSD